MKNLDHIGIAVSDLDSATELFSRLLGVSAGAVQHVDAQQVKVCFFHLNNIKLELIQATHPDSPIAKFIAHHGEGLHHIAFEVQQLEQCLEHHREHGFTPLSDAIGLGAGGKEVAFIHPKTTNRVLVELCRSKK